MDRIQNPTFTCEDTSQIKMTNLKINNRIYINNNKHDIKYSNWNKLSSILPCNHILIHITIISLILIFAHNAQSIGEPEELLKKYDCQPFNSELCDIRSFYTIVPFSNSLGHQETKTAIAELHKHYYLFQQPVCAKAIKAFLCSLYAPVCVPLPLDHRSPYMLPCKEECEEAQRVCGPNMQRINSTWPDEWKCSKFISRSVDQICFSDDEIDPPTNETSNFSHPQSTNEAPSNTDAKTHSSDIGPTKSYCDNMFDCRLIDSINQQQKVKCIEDKFVCDGKNDCAMDGNETSLDEVNCGAKCLRDSYWCAGLARCLNETEFCDGKVDCPSGFDEQNCTPMDFDDGKIVFVLLILSLSILISFLLKCFGKSSDKTNKSSTNEPDCVSSSLVNQNQSSIVDPVNMVEPHFYEPAESTASIYNDRCLPGNEYSAVSSVYTYPCYQIGVNSTNYNITDQHYPEYSRPAILSYNHTNYVTPGQTNHTQISNEESIQVSQPAPPPPPPTPAPSFLQ